MDGRRRHLRVVDDRAGTVTGADILRDGALMMSEYFRQRLEEVAETDPLRRDVVRLADQPFLLLALSG